MGGACSTHGECENCIYTKCWLKSLNGKYNSEDLGVVERVVLE
jgi:hypothetical protein